MVAEIVHTAWPLTPSLVFDGPVHAATVCLCGDVESKPESFPAPGQAIVWTADDTESRLLSDVPPTLAFLVTCGPWTAGCSVRLGVAATRHAGQVSVVDLAATIERLNWRTVESGRMPLPRPSLTPQLSTQRPDWFNTVVRDWMNDPSRPRSAARGIEATALEAGLFQIHSDLDGSHEIAQSIEGQGKHNGDYWHAIMHRREPDYGNSQYWFRRVGRHPVFDPLAREAAAVAGRFHDSQLTAWLPRIMPAGVWNPLGFVDCVAAAAQNADDSFRQAVEEIQYREMLLLFAQTYRDAVGS